MSDNSTLRHRKQSGSVEGRASSTEETVKSYLSAIEGTAPPKLKPYLEAIAPFVIGTAGWVEATIPIVHLAYDKWCALLVRLEPYRLDLLLPGVIGLIMCFFGGSYMTLIAACEAYRMVGLDSQLRCVKDLNEDWKLFLAANKEDDKVDDDNDGVADVLQISSQQLATRKTLLFMKTVDPNRIATAIAGLQSGLMAVVATLQLKFAKSITLGSAIGDIALKPLNKFVLPTIETVLPADYQKWGKPMLNYTVKTIAITIAWFIARVISAYHSAIRGGNMFTTNIIEYLNTMGYIKINVADTHIDEVAGYLIAGLGLWFQLSMGFQLPFPLNVLLFPFTLLEWWFMWLINTAN